MLLMDGGGMAVKLIGDGRLAAVKLIGDGRLAVVNLIGDWRLVDDWMGLGVRAVGSGCRRYGQRAYLQILLS